MASSPEILVNCPRTGTECPFLAERAAEEQDALTKIELVQAQYLGDVATTSVYKALLDEIDEEGSKAGFMPDKLQSSDEDARARIIEALANQEAFQEAVIKSYESSVAIAREYASAVQENCVKGPRTMRRYIICGERITLCDGFFSR